MAPNLLEHRAYPRLSWAHPARISLDAIMMDAQIADLSRGGCKLLPSLLPPLMARGLRPGDALIIHMDSWSLSATLRWATANCSALGCSFVTALGDEHLAKLPIRL